MNSLQIPPDARTPSPLFALPAIGTGTLGHESVSGHLKRLAEAHRLSVADLVTTAIEPFCAGRGEAIGFDLPNAVRGMLQRDAHLVNGPGAVASALACILAEMTGDPAVCAATTRPFRPAVASTRLLSSALRYCPTCLDEQARQLEPPWEPLLWQISDLTACQVHGTLLLSSCRHEGCGRPQRALTSTARVGWCTSCRRWLGTGLPQTEVAPERVAWEQSLAREVADVLAGGGTIAAQAVPDALQGTLDLAGLGVRATARAVGRSKGSVAMWRHGKVVPELDAWARIAAAAQVRLAPLLTDARPVPAAVPTPPELPDRRRPPIEWPRVRRVLRRVAKDMRMNKLDISDGCR